MCGGVLRFVIVSDLVGSFWTWFGPSLASIYMYYEKCGIGPKVEFYCHQPSVICNNVHHIKEN